MKIAIINANSTYGKPIVAEALRRGMDVTVFVRNENETEAQDVVVKEVPEITADDLAGFDAVVDASGIWTPEYLPRHYDNVMRLCDALKGTDTRFLIVGGAGTSFASKDLDQWLGVGTDHEIKLEKGRAKTTWFGVEYDKIKGFARVNSDRLASILGGDFVTMETVYAMLRGREDVNWVLMEPSCEFAVPLTGETLTLPYEDYAVDMLDELEHGIHYRQRIGATCN